jgi:2,3,4,5-tetrahydropyridine-2-carboxylate N-succinyltransferase
MEYLKSNIDKAWENKDSEFSSDMVMFINETLMLLDKGAIRVVEKHDGQWKVNDWVKKAILLSFQINSNNIIHSGHKMHDKEYVWFDKMPLKTGNWTEKMFREHGFRAVPGAIVRYGAFIQKNAVLMPSFVNIGAYVGDRTMIDTWSAVGSCAQIGDNCHISEGTGIGGVLEPLQANPVIIEDNVFIGARCEIVEGVIVEQGSVLGMGVHLGASTKIVERDTGKVSYGRIPSYSVVVPGSLPDPNNPNLPSLNCAVIIKRVDEKTRSKTAINELLR